MSMLTVAAAPIGIARRVHGPAARIGQLDQTRRLPPRLRADRLDADLPDDPQSGCAA
jgi:hypothetical protein